MQTNPRVEKALRSFIGLHSDEAYDHACGTYLSSKWAIRDLADRHGLTESEVETDIKDGLVEYSSTPAEPTYEPLDPFNFRIDSSGWREKALADGTRVRANRERDVWELADGQFKGEQFFTLKAARRETKKAGKRMPTEEEWLEIIRTINPEIDEGGRWHDDSSVRQTLGLKPAGYFSSFSSDHCLVGTAGYFWSSFSSKTCGNYLLVSENQIVPAGNGVRTNGFSVRCISE